MGDTGPCGPCSEIFIDRGKQYSCGRSTCSMGCDCDRYMEFWNLVFMQFERSSDGILHPLPQPSVDTGAGLERIAAILQEVDTNYDTDLFQTIIQQIAVIVGQPYDKKDSRAVSYRVIADHARATTFLVGDGVLPSNEGRGYVLRRIIRRAIRHGKKLGLNQTFFYKTVSFVIDLMRDAYPDLIEKRAFIEKTVLVEEEQFFKTLERGLALLDEETQLLASGRILSGDVAFKLYDTFGFPLDLTRVICAEKNLQVDEGGFERCMDRQRSESRKHWKGSGDQATSSTYLQVSQLLQSQGQLPQFVGYDQISHASRCVAILVPHEKGLESVDFYSVPPLITDAQSTEKFPWVEAVFAETPFYGESGGQVGDRGRVCGGSGFEGEVVDVQKPVPDLIVAHIRALKGTLKVGQLYQQETHAQLRAFVARNHTATHLLQWALREVLGKNVKQAGSLVHSDFLRFDFTYHQALTDVEISRVEDLVNEKIWNAELVSKNEMKKEEAIRSGAIAFFGEKYGDRVRVVKVGEVSTELCGGTHVDDSSELSLFKIANESGIAAGVRRVIAYTSKAAFEYLRVKEIEVKAIQDRLKASSSNEIIGKIEKMAATERELRKQIEKLQSKSAENEVDEILSAALSVAGVQIIAAICHSDPLGMKRLRDISDKMKQKFPNSFMVLGMKDPEGTKASLLVAKGPEVPHSLNANDLLQAVVVYIEGKGGGKPDLAQAGGIKPEGLTEAMAQAKVWIIKKLNG